jgi:hypothetical protein
MRSRDDMVVGMGLITTRTVAEVVQKVSLCRAVLDEALYALSL